VVRDVSTAYPGTAIIGTGGVSTGEHAVEMLLAGASAVGVGTATFAEPRAPLRIVEELQRWCAKHDVARVTDLVGQLREG
jgi:dihydroorotate dehydrogenase (NAD+) catalytic subunit